MSNMSCRTMSLITTTLLTAACWLGGCDGSQKTQPVQNATPAPAAPTTPLTELERQAVGQWVVNITEYGKLLAETERTRDKDKPTSYVPMMGLMYAPLLTLSIAQDRTAVSANTESAKLKSWSLAKNRVLILSDDHAADRQHEPEWVALLRKDGLLWGGNDWKTPFERIVPTPTTPIAEAAVGIWTLDVETTEAHLNRYISAFQLFASSTNDQYLARVQSNLTSQHLPNPLTLEITLNNVTMKVGNRSRSWPYQIRAGLIIVELDSNETAYGRDGEQGTRSQPLHSAILLSRAPIITVGKDQLRIIADEFNMFPELASLPAMKSDVLTSIFFKRESFSTTK